MDAAQIERIETNVERAASAIFAGAVGCAVYRLLGTSVANPLLGACAAGAAALAYVTCNGALGALTPRKPRFAVSVFDVGQLDSSELILTDADRLPADELELTEANRLTGNELLLTDADRLEPATPAEPVVLDDILAEIGPDARVVRLFDPKKMPTPGQLKSRIDNHIEKGASSSSASDASQALSDALAELRRSLR